ncbi:MAG TPA: hypothetical protein VL551_33165 [Actinospica sp.]|nr:hypothetical protein [Actinospica sp.]
MSFLEKALEVSEKAFEETEHTIEEWNIHRHGAKLLLKLGVAYFAEQRLGGDHGPVERVLGALDGHASEHGEVDLDHLRAAHQVLGDEFIKAHDIDAQAEAEEKAEAKA